MKCPYCNAELNGWPHDYGDYHENGYGDGCYWDEYRCTCPHCREEFRWFVNYVWVEDDAQRMED